MAPQVDVALHGTREALGRALASARNADGGWGYLAGKRSRVEPTSLALLALAAGGEPVDAGILTRWDRSGGLLIDPAATHANVAFSGIAALVAQYQPLRLNGRAGPFVDALLRHQGAALPSSTTIKQDNALIGWPWLDGTFSWVEPTSWCLLAVKRWQRMRPSLDRSVRIDQGERLLRDRVCRDGGWNYGNPQVLGKVLQAYAATSALALLALQNWRDDPVVRRSSTTLRRLCTSEQSGFALALSVVAFNLLGEPAADVERALAALWQQSSFAGETVATALALYAVNGAADHYEAFRV